METCGRDVYIYKYMYSKHIFSETVSDIVCLFLHYSINKVERAFLLILLLLSLRAITLCLCGDSIDFASFFFLKVALDRAAHLMDAVAFGHKDWDGVREELAEVRDFGIEMEDSRIIDGFTF